MNVSFKILWFEDEPDWAGMEKMRIISILKEHELKPIIHMKTGEDFDIREIQGNEYDLILVDYMLEDDTKGDEIVSAIRQNSILTDVLFYSSQELNMISAIAKKFPAIDGVYFTQRDYTIFTEKAKRLISKIVRRSEDIVNLRGFVLDNSSDFELRIKEILNFCWEKFGVSERRQLEDKLNSLLDSKLLQTKEKIEKVKAAEAMLSSANNTEALLFISDRLSLFQTAIGILTNAYQMPTSDNAKTFYKFYYDRIGTYRNKFGHLKLGDTKITINGEEICIDQGLHRRLRSNIALVDEELSFIENFITTQV